MKKVLFLLFCLANFVLAASDYKDALEKIGDGGAAGGAVVGHLWIHGVFWGKVLAFVFPIMILVSLYFAKTEQNQRGGWKFFFVIFGGIVLGSMLTVAFYSAEDSMYTIEGCASKVAKAYLQDAVNMGFKDSYTFGTQALATGCFGN